MDHAACMVRGESEPHYSIRGNSLRLLRFAALDPPVVPAGKGSGEDPDMTEANGRYTGRTAWARNLQTPLRTFLRTETGSAAILLGATVAALVWVNIDATGYESVWRTELAIRVGGAGLSMDLRHWVNSGLMTLFFFVVGLEARREFDIGELRERRRFMLPLAAGLGGMIVPIVI